MAVGDDQFFIAHLAANQIANRRVGDSPDTVDDTVLVGDLDIRGSLGREQAINLAGIAVQHKDLSEVSTGSTQEVQAVSLGLREGLLVTMDEVRGVVLDVAQGDETAAF